MNTEEKKEIMCNGITYRMVNGVLYRSSSASSFSFNDTLYDLIRIPQIYRGQLYKEFITDFSEELNTHIFCSKPENKEYRQSFLKQVNSVLNKGIDIIGLKKNLFVSKSNFLDKFGTYFVCTYMNILYKSGMYSMRYINPTDIIKNIESKNLTFDDELKKIKLLAMDNVELLASIPPYYKQSVIYWFNDIIYQRYLKQLPTIYISETSLPSLINTIDVNLFTRINQNIICEISL